MRDLADVAFYLAEESGREDLAFRFLEAAEACFEQLAAIPAMGVAREYGDPELERVRVWRIAGFDDYLVFYRPVECGVEIIRVIHGSRDIERLFDGLDRVRQDFRKADDSNEVRENRVLFPHESEPAPPAVSR